MNVIAIRYYVGSCCIQKYVTLDYIYKGKNTLHIYIGHNHATGVS
jgi:hypothetical protein